MLRFLALAEAKPGTAYARNWRQEVVRRLSSEWAVVFDAPGLIVWGAGAKPAQRHLIHRDRGIVLGSLFDGSGRRVGDVNPDSLHDLLGDFWGNYVAFAGSPDAQVTQILRGPASPLPCLAVRLSHAELYFSRMEDCAELDLLTFSIDWMHLARTLHGPLCSSRTSLREVRELLPGMCDEWKAGKCSSRVLWSPVEVAMRSVIEDLGKIAEELRSTIRMAIQAQASEHDQVVMALSGGLDSSVVLSCLADAPSRPRIVCLTHFTSAAESDERRYARLAARRADRKHIEYARDAQIDVQSAVYRRRFEANPGLRFASVDRIEPDLARTEGATAIFRGHGGDELFYRHHLQLAIADLIRRRAFADLAGLLTHVTIIEGGTTWAVLGPMPVRQT